MMVDSKREDWKWVIYSGMGLDSDLRTGLQSGADLRGEI